MYNIVTCTPIARQRLVNTFPQKQTRGKLGRLLLGNEAAKTLSSIRDSQGKFVVEEELGISLCSLKCALKTSCVL
jgi:hypothetical protein